MANLAISSILEKMTGKDKDYRYMATSDLLGELGRESFKVDTDLEAKIANIVLQQLEDASGDVSALAVKCLAPLVKKVSETRVLEMMNKLCDKLLYGKDQHRDIVSIAMKTIVAEITSTTVAQRVLVSLSPQLMKGITGTGMKAEIKCEFLDILCDVLHRFGNLMTADHELLLNALLPQLNSNQASVRKKTISCIASLASTLSDDLLARTTTQVVKLLNNKCSKPEITRTNIQMIGALSRSVGYRFGPLLGGTVPVLIGYCTNASENDEELCEYSLQALESFLLRCPRDISSYCDEILHLSLEFLSYDPNFTDNMEEDTDGEDNDEDEDDESADEYTDDEDISWKVRRAAAKCLAAIIVSRPEALTKLYGEACPKLIDRFKEREEIVKMDVFNTFIELLRQTGNVTKRQIDMNEFSPRWLLNQEVPKIVKSINRQLREKSVRTKIGAFSVLKELVVLPNCLADHIGSLVPGIEKALNVLSSPILYAVSERYYKVTAEALRVCGELVRVVRPNFQACDFDFKPYVHPIYNAILKRLANQDQDQEVKECVICCMGLVISTFDDNLQRELSSCLPILVDQMGNEITRLTAVKCKFCSREGTVTMVPGRGRPLTVEASESGSYTPLMVFECRGLEPVDISFGSGWYAESVADWTNIPRDVLSEIFLKVPQSQLSGQPDMCLSNCTIVSKHWGQVILDEYFMKQYEISNQDCPRRIIIDILGQSRLYEAILENNQIRFVSRAALDDPSNFISFGRYMGSILLSNYEVDTDFGLLNPLTGEVIYSSMIPRNYHDVLCSSEVDLKQFALCLYKEGEQYSYEILNLDTWEWRNPTHLSAANVMLPGAVTSTHFGYFVEIDGSVYLMKVEIESGNEDAVLCPWHFHRMRALYLVEIHDMFHACLVSEEFIAFHPLYHEESGGTPWPRRKLVVVEKPYLDSVLVNEELWKVYGIRCGQVVLFHEKYLYFVVFDVANDCLLGETRLTAAQGCQIRAVGILSCIYSNFYSDVRVKDP